MLAEPRRSILGSEPALPLQTHNDASPQQSCFDKLEGQAERRVHDEDAGEVQWPFPMNEVTERKQEVLGWSAELAELWFESLIELAHDPVNIIPEAVDRRDDPPRSGAGLDPVAAGELDQVALEERQHNRRVGWIELVILHTLGVAALSAHLNPQLDAWPVLYA